jgi:hypothetical protein
MEEGMDVLRYILWQEKMALLFCQNMALGNQISWTKKGGQRSGNSVEYEILDG